MINKRISKISMIASLLVATMVNAQEFYTCVPKKSWWKDTMGESIRSNVPSANDISRAVKGAIPTPTPQKNWELIKSVNLNNYDNSIKLEPGNYKFILKTRDRKTIQNIVDSPATSNLGFVGYTTHWCKHHISDLRNFFNWYDKRNLYYLQKHGFDNCSSDNRAGISALVLGNIALFAYECECEYPREVFTSSTLYIYKKDDD